MKLRRRLRQIAKTHPRWGWKKMFSFVIGSNLLLVSTNVALSQHYRYPFSQIPPCGASANQTYCQIPIEEWGPTSHPHIERNVTRRQPRAKPAPAPRPGPGRVRPAPERVVTPTPAPAPALIAPAEPTLADQIQPLNCPRGFARIGETFYGGTRCAPIPMPSPAAGMQLPGEPTTDTAVTPPESQPTAQPIFSDTEPLSGPSPPPQLGEAPPPSQFNNTQAGVLANANWLDIMSVGLGSSKSTVRALAVAGALAATVGFGGGAMLMPLLKAWP